VSPAIETRSLPALARCYLAALRWSLAQPRARVSYPSCVSVYPRDCRSRRVLCRLSHSLHSYFLVAGWM